MSSVIDNRLYSALFGKRELTDSDVVSFSEHGRVGGVSTGQGFKFVTPIDGATPLEGNNPSLVLGYTDGLLTTITKTIGATDYQKTLTYDGNGVLTNVSSWVEL